jgi:hypothetical protein
MIKMFMQPCVLAAIYFIDRDPLPCCRLVSSAGSFRRFFRLHSKIQLTVLRFKAVLFVTSAKQHQKVNNIQEAKVQTMYEKYRLLKGIDILYKQRRDRKTRAGTFS